MKLRLALALTLGLAACARAGDLDKQIPSPASDPANGAATETAVLAGGCFWGQQGVFQHVKGVTKVVAGYSGGTAASANYDAVCSGTTDHAEAIRIRFDPRRISYGQLLKVFFADAAQREVAEAYIKQLDEAKVFTAPIATEVVPLDAFYDAERYHQNYAEQHPEQSYIAFVAQPKVEKLKKDFGARLKGV